MFHHAINPLAYVEIGVRNGHSMILSQCRSIGIDPDIELKVDLPDLVTLFETSSDQFFEENNLQEILGRSFDLAFIDGMHLAEYALRDFINLEKNASACSVVLVDDILPDDIRWTERVRTRNEWTGDVYKLILILKEYRPDLEITAFDVQMKGLASIANLNPTCTILVNNYEKILADIQNGKYDISTRDELASALEPHSCDTLPSYLDHLTVGKPKRAYLELLKSNVVGNIYDDNEFRLLYLRQCLDGKREYNSVQMHDISGMVADEFKEFQRTKLEGKFYDRSIRNVTYAHSMAGEKRIRNIIAMLDYVRINEIEGCIVECGIWRGGASIMAAGYNEIYGLQKDVFVCDSFDGLPKPSLSQDENLDLHKDKFPELAISMEVVLENFKKYNLLSSNVHFIKGWFKDSLPTLETGGAISLLRLDGDLYESTMNILENLYDQVVLGGVIIIDDYALEPCRQALEDFLSERKISFPELNRIDWTGAWWIKKK